MSDESGQANGGDRDELGRSRRVRSDVGLADWLLALDAFQGAAARRTQLAALLGFDVVPDTPDDSAPEPDDVSAGVEGAADPPRRGPRPDEGRGDDGVRPWDEPDDGDDAPLPVRVVPLERLDVNDAGPTAEPAWARGAPALPTGKESAHLSRPRLDPLLVPRWTRSVLTEVLAGSTAAGPIDVARVIEDVAARRLVADLPRLRRRTLARGVQLLFDRGPAMTPFFRDQEDLLGHARATVGREKVQILRFAASPVRGAGAGARPEWSTYVPPPPPTPVVVVTDLGIGVPRSPADRASADEWRRFAARVGAAGNPLLAFVPYGRRRWPSSLARVMTIVPWDRSTSADLVRRHFTIGGEK